MCRWQPAFSRELQDSLSVRSDNSMRPRDESFGPLPPHCGEGGLDIGSVSDFQGLKLKCQGLARDLRFFERIQGLTRVAEDGHTGYAGERFFEQLNSFATSLRGKIRQPSDVPA